MRLKPGIPLDYAETVLRDAHTAWTNARSSQDYFRDYTKAVDDTHSTLNCAFAEPDLASDLRSAAYWHFLQLGSPKVLEFVKNPLLGQSPGMVETLTAEMRTRNAALAAEIDRQIRVLENAQDQLRALKELVGRPGLPVVYDTNMLNHWQQPSDVLWRELFKQDGQDVPLTRLVVPLRVLDELDRQKYGDGALARKAATAIRYLERVLKNSQPGTPVELRPGEATLEVWLDADDRDTDADLAILRCAADLDNLHGDARVLTDDIGMRLRAQQMDLTVMGLPEQYRKPGTAMTAVPPTI